MVVWFTLLTAAFCGGLLQASTGFGYSLICMSVYSLVLPTKTALLLQATAATFTIGLYALRLRRYANLRLLVVPACFALAATFVGLQTANAINDALLKRCLGMVLVLLSVFSLAGKEKVRLSRGFASQAVAGSVSGLLGGLTNMSGPPMVLYLLQVTDDKNEYNGTLQCFFLITSLFKTVVNAASGRITGEILCMLPPLLLVTAIGSLLGFHLFRKMNMDTVKKAVNLLMIFIGLYYTFF